jgi:hypothetical protein
MSSAAFPPLGRQRTHRKIVHLDGIRVEKVSHLHLREGRVMGLWDSIQRFFRDAKVTEFYVRISKEEFQGNLHRASTTCENARSFVDASNMDEEAKARHLAKIDAWHRDLQRKISQLPPEEINRERRRMF